MNDLGGRELATFWRDSQYARESYVSAPFSEELLATVLAELEYRLPTSYVALMRSQNGGMPRDTCCPAPGPTSWAPDHIAIEGIMGIGSDSPHSLCGAVGSRHWIEEWEYPAVGVYFADCPSAGHDMVALDYTGSGPHGEPQVVHVDQDLAYRITVLAPNFAAFVRSLRPAGAYKHD
jgi:hypothetical protein